jgi:hypothetical protein
LGRLCGGKNCSLADSRVPKLVDLPTGTKAVRLSCAFTAVVILAEDMKLMGWGVTTSYEFVQHYPVELIDTSVTEFQTGQGYTIWRKADGTRWARGYNPRGSTGHKASMVDAKYSSKHPVWFAGEEFMSSTCTYSDTQRKYTDPTTLTGCNRLSIKFADAKKMWPGRYEKGELGPDREYMYQFTLDQCIAPEGVNFVWDTVVTYDRRGRPNGYAYPFDGRKGLCT